MWATRQGSIWDPASLHRYNYARANPVNYIDPSGRSNLMEIALNASNKFAQGVVLAALGHEMNCLYGAEASMLDVIVMGPLASREQMQILSAHMDVANCSAQITGRQLLWAGSSMSGWLGPGGPRHAPGRGRAGHGLAIADRGRRWDGTSPKDHTRDRNTCK